VQNWQQAFLNCYGLDGVTLPELDFSGITNGTQMWYNVTMPKATYNAMLDQLANGRGDVPAAAASSVTFHGGKSHYDASTGGYDGTAARGYLTGTKSWTIADGGTP
jgi:hypothetical protein